MIGKGKREGDGPGIAFTGEDLKRELDEGLEQGLMVSQGTHSGPAAGPPPRDMWREAGIASRGHWLLVPVASASLPTVP